MTLVSFHRIAFSACRCDLKCESKPTSFSTKGESIMRTNTSSRRRAFKHVTLCTLLITVFLASNSIVQAQKVPPLFNDSTTSAFDPAAIKALETTAGGTDPVAAKLARNKLVAIGVEQVDAAFNDYRKKSRKRHDLLQFLFDFLEIGASSAINIITGTERSRELIAEGLSMFQGSRAAFNKDFKFLERQLLFDKMVAKRAQKLKAIYEKVNSDVVDYPWEQARSELREYFYAGTMDEALSSLSVDTGAEAQASLKALEDAKKAAGVKGKVTKAETDADAAITPLFDALVKSQDLAKAKAVYDLAQKDPTLEPLLKGLPQEPEVTPEYKPIIEGSLAKIANGSATFIDYHRVLLNLRTKVMRIIGDDPKPAAAFIKILGGK